MSLIAFSTGDSVTNLGFLEKVKALAFPDLEGSNLSDSNDRFVQNGLIIAQTYCACLRNNNVNFYDKEDITIGCNVATLTGPEKSRIQAVYAFKPCGQCSREHYGQRSVGAIMCRVEEFAGCACTKESDICNAVKTGVQFCDEELGGTESEFLCEDKLFAKGSSDKLYFSPPPPCDYKLAVHWEGIKRRYEDADLIADDDDLIYLLALYLKGQQALWLDNNLKLHTEIMRKPERFGDWGGTFWQALSDMNHRCREERRIRKDHACEAIFDDSALNALGMIADPPIDQSECVFSEAPGVCPEGQYSLDGVCTDCVTPVVALTANITSIIPGQSVVLSWSNTVPAGSSVKIEYGGTVVPVSANGSGEIVVTPAEDTIYLITAITACGNAFASASVTVNEPCLCPDGLPNCLQLTKVDPFEFPLCGAHVINGAESILWDGTMPRLSDCRWGVEFVPVEDEGIGGVAIVGNGGPTQFKVIVDLVSCDPYVYRMSFYIRDISNNEVIFWQGLAQNSPVGTYVSQQYGVGEHDFYCYENTNFEAEGCFDTPCVKPVITFDPPAGSVVSYPSLVFLHSTGDFDSVYYSLDNGVTYYLYVDPISMESGDVLKAYAVTELGCLGDVTAAGYIEDTVNGLEFSFICDEQDHAGVFGVFTANGSNDYHWRIKATRAVAWVLNAATIYETNSAGLWVTGQAWATENPIYPPEISPTSFAVYPMVLFNGVPQVNSAYGDPVASYGAGSQILHGYGQPFVALTGYFRLELRVTEDGYPFTIYKLIPHTCVPECPASVTATSATISEDGRLDVAGGVTPGAQYRIRLSSSCGSGAFETVAQGFSVSGVIAVQLAGYEACCDRHVILSEYCTITDEWIESAPIEVEQDGCGCFEANEWRSLPDTISLIYTAPDFDPEDPPVESDPVILTNSGYKDPGSGLYQMGTVSYAGDDGLVNVSVSPGLCAYGDVHSWGIVISTQEINTMVFQGYLDSAQPVGGFAKTAGVYFSASTS